MQIKELGHVVLYVTNLKKIADFYKNILGFNEIARKDKMAFFSSGRTHHELLLIEIGDKYKKSGIIEPGLYHIGFKIGDTDKELKNAISELKKAGVPINGAADHTISKGIYLEDPDGNEIELYVDVSDEWKKGSKWAEKPTKHLHIGED